MFWDYLFIISSSTWHLTGPILLILMILIPIIAPLTMHPCCLSSCFWQSIGMVRLKNILSYSMIWDEFVLFSFFYKRRELSSFFLLDVHVRKFFCYFYVVLHTLFGSSKVSEFRINKFTFVWITTTWVSANDSIWSQRIIWILFIHCNIMCF